MRRRRFSVEQIVTVLKQAELGVPVAELIRQLGSPSKPCTAGKKQVRHCCRPQ